MARPRKNGLDYFPLDVNMDDKVSLVEAQHGIVGFGVLIKMFQKIYAEGYYYEWTEKEQLLFSNRVSVDRNTVTTIVSDCIRWGIFDSSSYKKYNILTSKGIQERFVTASYKRNKVIMHNEYILISVIDRRNIDVISINDIKNEDVSDISSIPSTQSKGEESKVNESKVREGISPSLDEESLELCNYFTTLRTGESISAHIDFIKICISDYGFQWTKEAIKMCVAKKNKFIKPWISTVLMNWKNEGKEITPNGEDSRDSEPTNTSNKAIEYDFKAYGS